VKYIVNDKDEFLINLGGKDELKKVLNRLVKEQEILRIEIEQLICDSIVMAHGEITSSNWATWRILNKMPGQHKVLFDTDCDESPYGMHGVASLPILSGKCIWCHIELDDL